MAVPWCDVCNTRHASRGECPGELLASGPERHGWRVVVRTSTRVEVYGVLVAEAGERWRARIVTYPNMLWSVPGGRGTLKFAGDTAPEAEGRAVEFVQEHCRARGYRITDEVPTVQSRPLVAEKADRQRPRGSRAPRFLRSLVIRFGETAAEHQGMTADLSRGGLFIMTDKLVPAGRGLKMLLELDPYTVPLVGRVAWVRPRPQPGRPAGMGIQLQAPPALYSRFVRSLEQAEESGSD